MDRLLLRLVDQPAWLIYAVTGLVVFIEDALFLGFVFPGETVAILGGLSASLGHTELGWMIALVVGMAIVGDSVGYEVGRYLGPRLLEHRLLAARRPQLDKAQDFLRRRGGLAVLLGRWTAFFRAVMPALAGISRMPYRRFLPWNVVGGLVWGVVVVTGGYLAGRAFLRVMHWVGRGAATALVLAAVVAFVALHVRRRRRRTSAVVLGPETGAVEVPEV